MFKYSKLWLERLAKEQIDISDFNSNWLDLQGFEVATVATVGSDSIVELEVKANRPDMLSHLGVLREYNVYKGRKDLPKLNSNLQIVANQEMPIDIAIDSPDVDGLMLLSIEGIDNTKETPEELKSLLDSFGIPSISPAVDISNIIMLEIGQPIHIFDTDKLDKSLVYTNADDNTHITTLHGDELKISKGSIVIRDNSGVACLAGMIGSKRVEVDKNTKNIIIESAHFMPIPIRKTSQSMHLTTLASYRFERGVDSDEMINAGLLCAEMIIDACGGKMTANFVKHSPKPDTKFTLSASDVNRLLGSKFSPSDIVNLLNSYYYQCKVLDTDRLDAICPKYRLDLFEEIDIIGDIAQIYGYHNIEPTLPDVAVQYQPNYTHIYSETLRQLLVSQGLNECISYSFIHKDANKMLNLDQSSDVYNGIEIINPLSIKFGIMRSSLVYSMLNTYIFNLSKNGECEPIFDIGSVFFHGESETGHCQKTAVGVLLNGTKIAKGFGIDKNIEYDFYDIKQILELIMSEFSMNIDIKPSDRSFFQQGKSLDVYFNQKLIGFLGVIGNNITTNFENGKLIKGDVVYMELYVDMLDMGSTSLGEIYRFPSIIRQYNFLVPKSAEFADYSATIRGLSPFVLTISVKDVYIGKGVPEGYVSVLLEIEYASAERTLTNEEVENIENDMYNLLANAEIKLKN